MSRYTDAELSAMARTALIARSQNDLRWQMLSIVLCQGFNMTESELVEKLEQFAGKGV